MNFIIIISILFVAWFIYGPLPTIYYKYFCDHSLKSLNYSDENNTDKTLLLTFDDGPDKKYTNILLQLLEEENIHALFFSITDKAQKYPQVMQQITNGGHSVGLHADVHSNMWFMTPGQTKKVFENGLTTLKQQNIIPAFYRPPFGNINIITLYYCKKYQLIPLLWTVIAGDWENIGTDLLIKRLQKKTHNQAVILLHDSGEDTGGEDGAALGTITALQKWLPEMKKRGFKFAEPANVAASVCSNKGENHEIKQPI